MLIKIKTNVFLEVDDKDVAEEACSSLDVGLSQMLDQAGFPHGEVVQADVDTWEEVSAEEAEELGLTE